jgi:hypothetical protein
MMDELGSGDVRGMTATHDAGDTGMAFAVRGAIFAFNMVITFLGKTLFLPDDQNETHGWRLNLVSWVRSCAGTHLMIWINYFSNIDRLVRLLPQDSVTAVEHKKHRKYEKRVQFLHRWRRHSALTKSAAARAAASLFAADPALATTWSGAQPLRSFVDGPTGRISSVKRLGVPDAGFDALVRRRARCRSGPRWNRACVPRAAQQHNPRTDHGTGRKGVPA